MNRLISVIYLDKNKNDSLTFEGELKISIENGNHRPVLVKEKMGNKMITNIFDLV